MKSELVLTIIAGIGINIVVRILYKGFALETAFLSFGFGLIACVIVVLFYREGKSE